MREFLGQLTGEIICDKGEFTVYRPSKDAGEEPVLVKVPSARRPPAATIERLEHEYEVTRGLNPELIVRPLRIERRAERVALVLEDDGTQVNVAELLGAPMEAGLFLKIALGTTMALAEIHQHALIHKDLKPQNLLFNPGTGHVRMTGFGIASRLPRERQNPEPPEGITGTLAYMAPEQTGRMNRSIDSRSDLYALGCTFYEMLTGVLPFTATDPMGWVHCHIAKEPMPPGERVAVPGQISAIVMKLLAKPAEERYQTASGLAADLRRCLAEWESCGRIDPFPLGAHDIPDRLVIPEKLYGRDSEINVLLAAFERVVAGGTSELVLISGYSGIGKSSVVNELHKVLVAPRGLFASGKFDQFKRDIPYATLAQAFQTLVRQVLGKSETEVAHWRDTLREALGPNGQLIINIIPEIELVIGEQPPVPELASQDAQNRFQMVFRRFLGVFARPEHPLVLFLDDLQWLDSATLDLFDYLITEPEVQHLLLVGAYRDNEVGRLHPLMRMMESIRKTPARIQEIVLAPLGHHDVCRLVSDSLHCEQDRAEPLALLIHEKTGGNPFFAIQFFTALAEQGLLAFNPDTAAWNWDLAHIGSRGFTDNIVDLMVGKLNRLPKATQETLKQLACLGNTADIATLSLVLGEEEESTHAALWDAVRAGLVLHLKETYAFLHDRVQEAAYSLIPEGGQAAAHLRIGRVLAARTASAELDEKIFEILNQLNRGAALIWRQKEKNRLAELNMIAGRRAKSSTAYKSALGYFSAGIALLGSDPWENQHDLTYQLCFGRAQCEYLNTNFEEALSQFDALLTRAKTKLQKVEIYCAEVDIYTRKTELAKAVELGIEGLGLFGIKISPHPTRKQVLAEYNQLWVKLGARRIEELAALPGMTDPEMHSAMSILEVLYTGALCTDQNLFLSWSCHMVDISLTHGNCDASAMGYGYMGLALGPVFGRYREGYDFGKLGYDLVEKHGLLAYKAKINFIFGDCINCWHRHLGTDMEYLRVAFDTAVEVGDLTTACYCCNHIAINFLALGKPLEEVHREAERRQEFTRRYRFDPPSEAIIAIDRVTQNMRGLTAHFSTFSGDHFDQAEYESFMDGYGTCIVTCWYYIMKLQARFMSGDFKEAKAAAEKAAPLLWSTMGHIQEAEYWFYYPLVVAACHQLGSPKEQRESLKTLKLCQEKLRKWAENCPENFLNKYALVSAEIARITRRPLEEAMALYEQAILSARENGFVQNEGIANELAAGIYLERGFETIARAYLREARCCYARWGAAGKVRQLDERHPWLAQTAALETVTMAVPPGQLDVMTIVKAQRAISSEIVLERLAETLLRIVLENAGAQKGYLYVIPETQLLAVIKPGREEMPIEFSRAPSVAISCVSTSILNYVKRACETVILSNAGANAGEFSEDPYILQAKPKSLLCMPIVRQARLIGVLYLENNLVAGAFTQERRAVLEMLASQAAISLETARLYSNLQRSQDDLKDQTCILQSILDSMGDGVIVANEQGEFILFNPAAKEILGIDAIEGGIEHWAKQYGMYLPDQCTLYPAEELPLSKALRGESVDKAEIFMLHSKRPQGFWLSVTARPLTDQTGLARGGVAVFSDFTARKKAEEELGKLNAELEQKVDERTAQLRAALRKETLLRREIHHRVKNNLQVISSLLFLQSIHVSDAGTQEVLRESRSRTRALALIHEKLYQSDNLTKIEFASYIRQLAASMFESYRISASTVQLRIAATGIFLGLDVAIPCGLIITELVSNALKYAFSEGKTGRIDIEFQLVKNGIFQFSVRDSGAGLPEGFDPEKVRTLGVKLVCDLATQLNGTVEFKNENGTVVNITFPEPLGSEHE
ncbi:MAG: histidine kinase [Chthoniobacteraceae bacterium]|nr:histidine kinase [Chthoniobacteraceae bacterium]